MNRDLQVIVLDPNAREICTRKLALVGIRAEPIAAYLGNQTDQENSMGVIRERLSLAVASVGSG